MKFKFSIIIPVLNESKNVGKLCEKLIHTLKKYNYEIIFVDDGSTDNTILEIKKRKEKNIFFYIRNSKIKDLSKSCYLGIKKSKYKNILIMDGDLQHDPAYIPKFIDKYIKYNADIVVGVRDFKRKHGLTFLRSLSSKLIIKIFNLFLGKKTKDPMSGFFIFKKKIYNSKLNYFKKGYKILSDLIYTSNKNLKIYDYDILFRRRKENSSKMNIKVLIYIIEFFIKKLIQKVC